MKKIVSGIMLMPFVLGMLTMAFEIKSVKSEWIGTVYIRSDGSVDPPGAPIETHDNITYTLISNITSDVNGIVVERDNIIIDGAGLTVQGMGVQFSDGVNLTRRDNVTIKNMEIKAFYYGIFLSFSNHNTIYGNNITANSGYGVYLYHSSNNTIYGNNITDNEYGVYLYYSSNNTIYGNKIANSEFGIWLYYSLNNTIYGNKIANSKDGIRLYYSINNTIYGSNITANSIDGIRLYYSLNNTIYGNNITANSGYGVYLYHSSNNTIYGNNITDNEYGIPLSFSNHNTIYGNNITDNEYGVYLYYSSNNTVHCNNFIDNVNQAFSGGSVNVWDNGYPSGGNYWSDYYSTDLFKGPNQDQYGSDGIGDSPYVIDSQNRDNYPLMYPYGSLPPPYQNLTIATPIGGTTEPPPGTYTYVNETIVSVTATPNVGYSFDYWLLDGTKRTENPISILMHSNHTLEAYFIDNIPPEISEPCQDPLPNNVQTFQNVTVWVNVTDYGTGIKNVTLWYSLNNGTTWEEPIDMTALPTTSDATITYKAVIPGYENCTWITYKITAYDNNGNNATKDNNGYYYQYHVIPESSPIIILIISLISTLIVTTVRKLYSQAG